jgi:hypothetical protein
MIEHFPIKLPPQVCKFAFSCSNVLPRASRSLFMPRQLSGQLLRLTDGSRLFLPCCGKGCGCCLHLTAGARNSCSSRGGFGFNISTTAPQRVTTGLGSSSPLAGKR